MDARILEKTLLHNFYDFKYNKIINMQSVQSSIENTCCLNGQVCAWRGNGGVMCAKYNQKWKGKKQQVSDKDASKNIVQ